MFGPPWFLEKIGLELKNDERVSVKGIDDGYNVFLVSSITKGTKTYEIFDADALSEEGGYGCGGMWNNDHNRAWGKGSRGMWNRSGFSGRNNNRSGMMQDAFNSGRRRQI